MFGPANREPMRYGRFRERVCVYCGKPASQRLGGLSAHLNKWWHLGCITKARKRGELGRYWPKKPNPLDKREQLALMQLAVQADDLAERLDPDEHCAERGFLEGEAHALAVVSDAIKKRAGRPSADLEGSLRKRLDLPKSVPYYPKGTASGVAVREKLGLEAGVKTQTQRERQLAREAELVPEAYRKQVDNPRGRLVTTVKAPQRNPSHLVIWGNPRRRPGNPVQWATKKPGMAAALFVGMNVRGKPKWSMRDVIRAVSRHKSPPDATYIAQKGVFTGASGRPETEKSAQVVIYDTAGSTPAEFALRMKRLAERVACDLKQEVVIADVRRGGLSKEVAGMAPPARCLKNPRGTLGRAVSPSNPSLTRMGYSVNAPVERREAALERAVARHGRTAVLTTLEAASHLATRRGDPVLAEMFWADRGYALRVGAGRNPYLLPGRIGFVPGVVYASRAAKARVMAIAKKLRLTERQWSRVNRGWWMWRCYPGSGRGEVKKLIDAVRRDLSLRIITQRAEDARTPYGTFRQCYLIVARADESYGPTVEKLYRAAEREKVRERKKRVLRLKGASPQHVLYGRVYRSYVDDPTGSGVVTGHVDERRLEAARQRRVAREAREAERRRAKLERQRRKQFGAFGPIDVPAHAPAGRLVTTIAPTKEARLAAARRAVAKELAGPMAGARRAEGLRQLEELRGTDVPRDPRARRQWAEKIVGAAIRAYGKNPCAACLLGNPCSRHHVRTVRRNPEKADEGVPAYRTFHGSTPKGYLKLDVPDDSSKKLVVVGKLKRIEYETPPHSQRAYERGKRVLWTHAAGDHGKGARRTAPAWIVVDMGKSPPRVLLVNEAGKGRFGFVPSHGLTG